MSVILVSACLSVMFFLLAISKFFARKLLVSKKVKKVVLKLHRPFAAMAYFFLLLHTVFVLKNGAFSIWGAMVAISLTLLLILGALTQKSRHNKRKYKIYVAWHKILVGVVIASASAHGISIYF